MANFLEAYSYMIPSEVIRYGTPDMIFYSDDPDDHGGKTAWGITEAVARENGYTGDMRWMSEETAKDIYHKKYWRFSGVFDQRIASKLFDIAVNMGLSRAVRYAQMLVRPNDDAFCDGNWGPRTEAAVNNADTTDFLMGLVKLCSARYIRLAKDDPSQVKYLRGWLKRAERLPS